MSSQLFFIETDASGTGIGTILSQDKHQNAFFWNKLDPSMQRKSAYVRELYAITEAIAKCRHYISGHKIVIHTNQLSLKDLSAQNIKNPEQQRWLHKLLGYDFTIEYKPGKDNLTSNALSHSFFMATFEPMAALFLKLLMLSLEAHICQLSKFSALKEPVQNLVFRSRVIPFC